MIKLIRASKQDIKNLSNWLPDDDAVFQWTGDILSAPFNSDEYFQYIQQHSNAPKPVISFSALEIKSNEVIGHIDLDYIDKAKNHNATIIRVLVKPELRNQGVGKKMLNLVLDFAFNALNLYRVELKVFDFNKQAINCYEQSGFSHEGTLRKVLRYKNKYRNLLIMSMLRPEYKNSSS